MEAIESKGGHRGWILQQIRFSGSTENTEARKLYGGCELDRFEVDRDVGMRVTSPSTYFISGFGDG